jgi:predicted amidohydrolase YtcJ
MNLLRDDLLAIIKSNFITIIKPNIMKLKHVIYFILLLTVISIVFSCSAEKEVADTVFVNAKVYTKDGHFDQAIAIKEGKIIFTGTDASAKGYVGKETKVKDLSGRLVLPGFHDVHMHPLEAFTKAIGDFFFTETITDPNDYLKELKANVPAINSNGWRMAFGHNIDVLMKAKEEPRLILDRISPNEPMFCWEATSHSCWVNSAALKKLGFTSKSPDPVGGCIVKNAQGEPNGILLDNAGDIALQTAIAINPTIEKMNYDGLVNIGLPLIAKNGITSFCEARTYWKQNFIKTWKEIKKNNLLTARVVLTPWVYPGDSDESTIENLKKMYDKGDDMMRITEFKMYSDGLTFNTTAALKEPYAKDMGFPFGHKGLNYIDEKRMTHFITELEKIGYDAHVHAIGDRGIYETLNAIEGARKANGDIGARHRVTHLEIVDQKDFPRFKKSNIIADMQVVGEFTQPSHWHENDEYIGVERSNVQVPLKSIFDTGARVTLSSDYDVSSLNPLDGLQNAVTRKPQALPSVEEALKCYTINAAYVMRQEDKTGSLEVEKYADLIILDRDIFTIPVNTISKAKVELTLLGGKEVYVSPTFNSVIDTDVKETASTTVYPTQDIDDEFYIKFNSKEADTFTVTIVDVKGKIVSTSNYKHPGNIQNKTIEVSKLPVGNYSVSIISNNKYSKTEKISIKRAEGLHEF